MDNIKIVSSVLIKNGIVVKNKERVLENEAKLPCKEFLKQIYRSKNISYPKFFKMDIYSKLGFITSEVLLEGEDVDHVLPDQTALVFGNSNATLATDTDYFETVGVIPSPALFVYTLPNIMMGEISIKNEFRGENLFFIDRCFSAEKLVEHVGLTYLNPQVTACLAGWVDYSNCDDYTGFMCYLKKFANNSKCINFTASSIKDLFSHVE